MEWSRQAARKEAERITARIAHGLNTYPSTSYASISALPTCSQLAESGSRSITTVSRALIAEMHVTKKRKHSKIDNNRGCARRSFLAGLLGRAVCDGLVWFAEQFLS